jgi:hypothetical protein
MKRPMRVIATIIVVRSQPYPDGLAAQIRVTYGWAPMPPIEPNTSLAEAIPSDPWRMCDVQPGAAVPSLQPFEHASITTKTR